MGQVVADISTDHSANIFRVKLHCEDKSTTVFQNARNYIASQPHKDMNLEQHLCENSNFIASMKLRDALPGDMKTEDVSKTMVVAFILFQRSAYTQVKMIQSRGVWKSPLMNKILFRKKLRAD